MKPLNPDWKFPVYPLALCLAVALVYATGLRNALVFDDARLTDGTVFGGYGSLLQLKQRLLSYGSFVWLQTLVGENWPIQRAVNVVLHLATCWALHQLFALLLPRIAYARETVADPDFAPSQAAALRLGVLFFALNPVAVYAVAYLIQRSIVMATLFGVLACWAFVQGMVTRKPAWYGAALLLYLLAVFSKEHAVLFAGLCLPLYIFLRRPGWQQSLVMLALASGVLAAGAAFMLQFFPHVLGQVFDETSRHLVAELARQEPGVPSRVYALSVLNEAGLFFYYGLLWVLPYVGWMSIDMHPPFPLTLTSMPHILGAFAYLAVLLASVLAVLRRSDVWGFVGLCLLFPLVLFWSEFATVWVQDPFVLYRSYLWAIPLPALIAVLLSGFAPATLHKAGVVVAIGLMVLSIERVASQENNLTLWSDVIEKYEIPGPANAVGRNRAFLYRGLYHLKHLAFESALADFRMAQKLGDHRGEAAFQAGVTLQAMNRHADALASFAQSELVGYKHGVLYFHRAESQFALAQLADAMASYTQALAGTLAQDMQTHARERRAESAMQLRRFADAAADFDKLLQQTPKQPRYLMGLGLARLGLDARADALAIFQQLVEIQPDALAFYGRALAHAAMGNKQAAEDDIARSLRLEPGNTIYQQVQRSIAKGEKLSL